MTNSLTLRQHGVIDYVHGVTVASSPFLFGFSEVSAARHVLLGLGIGTIGYSLMTRYPYSAAKVVPLGVHMSLDIGSGIAVALAPWIFGYRERLNPLQVGLHILMGVGAFTLVALTQPKTERGQLSEWTEDLKTKLPHAA